MNDRVIVGALGGAFGVKGEVRLKSFCAEPAAIADYVPLTGGTPLGVVKTVVDHGAGDLLEITPPNTSETVFLPFTQAAVPTVDLKAGKIVADPPEGLFGDS